MKRYADTMILPSSHSPSAEGAARNEDGRWRSLRRWNPYEGCQAARCIPVSPGRRGQIARIYFYYKQNDIIDSGRPSAGFFRRSASIQNKEVIFMDEDMRTRQLEKDAVFYYALCLTRRLLEEGMITKHEYKEIVRGSADALGTSLIA